MLYFRVNGDGPAFGGRAGHAVTTRQAVAARELDLNHGMVAAIHGRGPTQAGLAGWTCRLLGLPVMGEILRGEALAFLGLTVVIASHGSEQVDGVAPLTLDNQLGIDQAGVGQLDDEQQVASFQARADTGRIRVRQTQVDIYYTFQRC